MQRFNNSSTRVGFEENEHAVFGALVTKRWSEFLGGDRGSSTGLIADRDYRTEDASTDTLK